MRVVRVLPDGPIDKAFDYSVPDELADQVRVGTMVRVALQGRRVGGWVVGDDVAPPPGVDLRPIAKVSGLGPTPDLVDVAAWGAWRWAGRRSNLLTTASPERLVRGLPPPGAVSAPVPAVHDGLVRTAFDRERAVLRLPPVADLFPVALAAAGRGNALIVTPAVSTARHLATRLRRAGVPVALQPRDWAQAAAGATVVGARAAAWAPVAGLAAVVVIDEHDEGHQEERVPAWHARDVAIERARRAGVPCVLVSPSPSLEALEWGELLAYPRSTERSGWPILHITDTRRVDPREGLYPQLLVSFLRSGARVVCVLNRKGRARLLVCGACGELARCETCGAAVQQTDEGLTCRRCLLMRPAVCQECGATRLKARRLGVSRVRDELEHLSGFPVVEVTAESDDELPDANVYVGTEAVLHRVSEANVVVFLDFDQELLAPRYRAAEQAMGLLVRAARLVGSRHESARIMVQTRVPDHEVLDAALHADPSRLAGPEAERRRVLGFPPYCALALVSGPAAPAFVEALGNPAGVELLGPTDGEWLLRAPDHQVLCDALAATPRPGGRLRIEVDPLRI